MLSFYSRISMLLVILLFTVNGAFCLPTITK